MSGFQNEELTKEFSMEEFSIAIKQMHLDKSPGPDDFNPGFYQNCWSKVGLTIFAEGCKWLEQVRSLQI